MLPPKEQVPRESYRPGDRLRSYVLEVNRVSKGPQVVLSRANIQMVARVSRTLDTANILCKRRMLYRVRSDRMT